MLSGAKVMPGSIETDRRTRELAAVATDATASGRGWTVGGCGGGPTRLLWHGDPLRPNQSRPLVRQ